MLEWSGTPSRLHIVYSWMSPIQYHSDLNVTSLDYSDDSTWLSVWRDKLSSLFAIGESDPQDDNDPSLSCHFRHVKATTSVIVLSVTKFSGNKLDLMNVRNSQMI